jgi:hypothetical protein
MGLPTLPSVAVNCKNLSHEALYDHFATKQDGGRWDKYNTDMLTFVNYIWNRNLGSVVAMSHSGIGEDVSNGFIQFICDNPFMMNDLLSELSTVRDITSRASQPTIEIRSKSLPREIEISGKISHITVMFRSPRFRNRAEASVWWKALAAKVTQSYETNIGDGHVESRVA